MTDSTLPAHVMRCPCADDQALRPEPADSPVALEGPIEQRIAARTSALSNRIAALEGFNRCIAHDLRGPLGNIADLARLCVEALARGDTTRLKRLLPMISAEADGLVDLIAGLLVLAEDSQAPLPIQPVSLGVLVRQAIASLHGVDEAARSRMLVHPLPEVAANPALIRQVYANLLSNALKFSRTVKEPAVEIGTMQHDGADVFYVRDNGIGFDENEARDLFAPFQRLHGACFEGHGMGLSIVKRIVERHGGRVWTRSRPNEGAWFMFTLAQHDKVACTGRQSACRQRWDPKQTP